MTHSTSTISDAGLKAVAVNSLVNLIAAGHARLRNAAGHRALAGLTDDELHDIGREDFARKPAILIEAGLMTRLMSMR